MHPRVSLLLSVFSIFFITMIQSRSVYKGSFIHNVDTDDVDIIDVDDNNNDNNNN